MIDHCGIAVRDFAKARAFYDAALAPLEIRMLVELPPSQTGGVSVIGYGRGDRASFWLSGDGPQQPRSHIAFEAADREMVAAFHAAALAAGAADNGAPGLRPHYHEHYYAAFVLDPDGNNIEAVCHEPERAVG